MKYDALLLIESATMVLPGAKATCTRTLQEWSAFRTDYLYIEEAVGKHFEVFQISVNGTSQINIANRGFRYNTFPPYIALKEGDESLSALVFKDRPKLRLDTCVNGGKIEIVVKNVSTEPQRFAISLWGTALE